MNNLKGFNEQEVFKLYKYLCIYENKIKTFRNSTEVYNNYPKLKNLDDIMSLFTVNYANNGAMQVFGVFVPKGFVYCTNTKSSKMYNVLYHLRNSIAHGQIEKDNDQIYLIDYKYVKDRRHNNLMKIFSGRGNLEASIIFQIIELIISTIEL
ncbi:MAG: hypothetical protein IJJ90_08485 [Prevotella sp.]|nr:hypothetical protein [Prevotella sp.]